MTAGCIFCQAQAESTFKAVLREGEHCFVVADNCPVSPGHRLIISKEHYPDWFAAPRQVQAEINALLREECQALAETQNPDGYNVGFNCGEAAGQTVMHLHVHLIPRYAGDAADPRGGVRGVIPEKQKYDAVT